MRNSPLFLLGALVATGCAGKEQAQEPAPDAQTWYVEDLSDGEIGSGTEEDPFRDLQHAIDSAEDGDTLLLGEGTFTADPHEDIDPTCGNCDDASFRVDIPITVGFQVQGKGLQIQGASREETILETGAGYGLYFLDAGVSSVRDLTITGGVRDADGQATDAAIVVKTTILTVEDVDLTKNNDLYQGEPDPVVGIMGIAGREGADLTVMGCNVLNNSWDGITLYRSDPNIDGSTPKALILNNTIGCTRNCISPNGRGVGIGITWDAQAQVINNVVHDYWKGIGSFGDSVVTVTNNVVRDQVGWGVIAAGTSTMDAVNNVISHNGTTGLAAWDSTASGRFINNAITANGWSSDEWVGKRTGVWMNSDGFEFAYNNVWDNEEEDVCTGGYPGQTPCTPIDFEGESGNLSEDPLFGDTYTLDASSPLINAGDPDILDADGTRSDIGVHGGPEAGRETL
jgi:hypothetical protein